MKQGCASSLGGNNPASYGTKLMGVSGHVNRPGCFELELGTKLKTIVEHPKLCQGMRNGNFVSTLSFSTTPTTVNNRLSDGLPTPIPDNPLNPIGGATLNAFGQTLTGNFAFEQYTALGTGGGAGEQKVRLALNEVSFDLRAGETLGIVGESGSGKTTAARCILRALRPTTGSVIFTNQGQSVDLATLPDCVERVLAEPAAEIRAGPLHRGRRDEVPGALGRVEEPG